MQPKAGGKLHLRLNTGTRPIVNKYRKGKLKRTLKREFKRAAKASHFHPAQRSMEGRTLQCLTHCVIR